MPDLSFQVESAAPVLHAVAPLLALRIGITNRHADQIHTVVLRCQIQIETTRRRYSPREQTQLRDLFGEPAQWSQSLRNMLWTHTHVAVPAFTESGTAELHAPCTFDFNIAATKYFYGLEEGEIPLCLLFSGSIFYQSDGGVLQVAPISWESEAHYRLPVKVWRNTVDAYYPNSAWLCLRRDTFERLYHYKMNRGIPTWEEALDTLLPDVKEVTYAR